MTDILVLLGFILALIIEIGFPLVLGYLLIKWYKLDWKLFLIGAAGFIGIQIIHYVLLIPTNFLLAGLMSNNSIPFVFSLFIAGIFLGGMAGILENLAKYGIIKYLLKDKQHPNDIFLFGTGWGGIESILLVGLPVLTIVGMMLLGASGIAFVGPTFGMNEQAIFAMQSQLAVLDNLPAFLPLIGAIERIFIILIHIALSLIVLKSIETNNKKYLIYAIIYHSALDFSAIFFNGMFGIFVTEVIIGIFAIIALWVITHLKHPHPVKH